VQHEINEQKYMTWYGGDLNQNESYPKLTSHKFIIKRDHASYFSIKTHNKRTPNTNKHTKISGLQVFQNQVAKSSLNIY
jgi:hypothetical protein